MDDDVVQRGRGEAAAALPKQLQVPALPAVLRDRARGQIVELDHLHAELAELRLKLRPRPRPRHHDRRRLRRVPQIRPRLPSLLRPRRRHLPVVAVVLRVVRPEAVVLLLHPGEVHRPRQNHPRGEVPVLPSSREVRVIPPHRRAADDDGVAPRALRPHRPSRGRPGDPRRVPARRRDLPVDRHRVLQDAERSPRGHAVQQRAVASPRRRDHLPRRRAQHLPLARRPGRLSALLRFLLPLVEVVVAEDDDVDAARAQGVHRGVTRPRYRMRDADHDARHPRAMQRVHARVLARVVPVHGLEV
mmetsp:Transcript_8788/g.32227  ORF Transcript_8788/g.32227 Transcript_8788/m.32227 type:complete len:302 (-) Transcript_8788:198-1103(-)